MAFRCVNHRRCVSHIFEVSSYKDTLVLLDGCKRHERVKVESNSTVDVSQSPRFDSVSLQDLIDAGVQIKSVNSTILNPTRIDSVQSAVEAKASEYLDNLVKSKEIEVNE